MTKLAKLKKRLYLKYLKYEKYVVWLVGTWIFAAVFMWLAKRIFDIYLPFSTWNAFLQTIGVLSFLVAIASAWFTWSSEKRSSIRVAAVRKEEQMIATIGKHERELVRREEQARSNGEAIASIQQDIDEIRNHMGRISAQVQQTEAEAIMQRKLALIERRLSRLEPLSSMSDQVKEAISDQ